MKKISMTLKALALTAAAFAFTPVAHAAPVVTNGDFSTYSPGCVVSGCTAANGNGGQAGYNLTIGGWTVPALNGSYVMLFSSGNAAQQGVPNEYGSGAAGAGGSLGIKAATNSPGPTPVGGGNFIGADPEFQNGAITQTIAGLIKGEQYQLSFFYAAGQQIGYSGNIYAGWQVAMGGNTLGSSTMAAGCGNTPYASGCFSGWAQQTYNFYATGTSETLSFLAVGGNLSGTGNLPPFALLDSVNLTDVPEPSTLSLAGFVLLGLGGLQFYRRRKTV